MIAVRGLVLSYRHSLFLACVFYAFPEYSPMYIPPLPTLLQALWACTWRGQRSSRSFLRSSARQTRRCGLEAGAAAAKERGGGKHMHGNAILIKSDFQFVHTWSFLHETQPFDWHKVRMQVHVWV